MALHKLDYKLIELDCIFKVPKGNFCSALVLYELTDLSAHLLFHYLLLCFYKCCHCGNNWVLLKEQRANNILFFIDGEKVCRNEVNRLFYGTNYCIIALLIYNP